MVRGLRLLDGRMVTDARIEKPGLDLTLTFDRTYSLRVFCDQFDESLDNYSVSFIGKYVCVDARSRVRISLSKESKRG